MSERSRLPVLLTELVLMLLVLALCSAVCLSIFASSRDMAAESGRLGSAAAWAQSAAEAYKAEGGDLAKTAERLDGELSGAGLVLGLDRGWQPAASGMYTLSLDETAEKQARITVSGPEGEIFSLEVKAVAHG